MPAGLSRSEASLAAALAGAMLAGDWTRPGLIDSGAVVLGARRRWLGPVARAVLAVYHRPPSDRPRELASVIGASEPFQTALSRARATGRPLRALARPTVATAMVRGRWGVPVIDDVAALADLLALPAGRLDWLADTCGYQRRTPLGPLQQYRYRWIERPGRTPRLLEAPTAALLRVQRRLLTEVLLPIPVHEAAHGFVRGRSVLTATAPHAGAEVLVRLDLHSFFSSIRAGRAYALLRHAGYPEPVAWTMTALMTVRTPVAVISAMPPGGDPADRHLVRQSLRSAHLPQGAATSPALANAIARRFDARCAGYAAAVGCTFTRYADDLLLSGTLRRPQVDALIRAIGEFAADEGFRINGAKTRVRRSSQRQQALGLVLNERPAVARQEYDRLRAILHNAARTSGPAQNLENHPEFRAQLAGRISWVAQGDPARGARLLAVFDRIDWNDSTVPGAH